MKKIWMSITLLAILVAGCRKPQEIGFLSDYSRLEKVSDSTLAYSASEYPFTGYRSFIVEPVQFETSDSGLNPGIQNDLRRYLELSARKAVLSGYDLTDKPAKGTAVLSISVTNLDSDSPVRVNPQAGAMSGAAIELKVTDSLTGNTLLSMIETRAEKPVSLSRLSRWMVAKNTIDQWTQTLEDALRPPQSVEIVEAPPETPEPAGKTEPNILPKQPEKRQTIAQNIP